MKRKVIVTLCACSLILSPAQFTYAQTQQQEQNSLELDGQKFANEDALWEYLGDNAVDVSFNVLLEHILYFHVATSITAD